jgi:two-component system CheB/CheR fusion protein
VIDQPDAEEFEVLLDYLRESRGFDFTGYKRSSLMRRIVKRMQVVGAPTFGAYQDHLQVRPEEFTDLFNFILINVTSFFRDEAIWQFLAREILPAIHQAKPPQAPIRVWTAGCASGEEAYSLAMLLVEEFGREAFVSQVKLYGTDADEEALDQARSGRYTAKQVAAIPDDLLAKYFQPEDDSFSFDKDLRRSVIFGRHDLVQDAPISRIDLLSCRNTLMYFNTEIQTKVMNGFHFALNPSGYLLLGKAEMLYTRLQTFAPVDLKHRVYAPAPRNGRSEAPFLPSELGLGEERAEDGEAWRATFESNPTAQLVVDTEGRLVATNLAARHLFTIRPTDVGQPIQDLEVSYRPLELRSLIEQAHAERRALILDGVSWERSPGAISRLDVRVVPLFDPDGKPIASTILFADATEQYRLEDELHTSSQELDTAMEELQSTNEELETTNEELQSTNEELETTNEELQSTNEELETMNEELQSTNAELQAVNEDASRKGGKLNEVNLFLDSVLRGMSTAVIVVNRDLHIAVWNHRSEELWGLRADEVLGQPLAALDIGLPVDDLSRPIREGLRGSAQHSVDVNAVNRRGQRISCRVSFSPLSGADRAITGLTLLVEELG